jgi:hypothetical protein
MKRYVVSATSTKSSDLFEVSHTDSDGKRITGQLYSADQVSHRLQELLSWGATDIVVTQK